jgi:hypothetical protein
LQLPVPPGGGAAGAGSVRLSRRDGGEVWERELDAGALASKDVIVNLPGGSIEPGDYVIALRRHAGAAEAITLAEYAFGVDPK